MTATLASYYNRIKNRSAVGPSSARFWEIDALRGIAVIMMVVYHLMYDFYFFRVTDAVFTYPFWFYFQRATASTFLFLVGVSLSVYRTQSLRRGKRLSYRTLFVRGIRIFAWGLVISTVTWFALGSRLYIRFGILHFIGVSILMAYPFLSWRWRNLLLGALLLVVGKWLKGQTFDWPWLFWLGLEPPNHVYVDFFPVIPWFGVVLFGIAVGNFLYRSEGPRWPLPDLSGFAPVRYLQWLGRHSLTIYLLHQPVLFALLIAILWGVGAF